VAFTVGIAAGALVTNRPDGANRPASTRTRSTTQVEGSTTGRGGGAAAGTPSRAASGSRGSTSRRTPAPGAPAAGTAAPAGTAPGAAANPSDPGTVPPSAVTTPPGAGSDVIIGAGVRTVGVRMKAGRWQTAGRPGCYWAIYAITGLPEDADFVDLVDDGNADGQTTVDLTPGQFFEIQDCPNWSRIG
jgi:hypothetical protein